MVIPFVLLTSYQFPQESKPRVSCLQPLNTEQAPFVNQNPKFLKKILECSVLTAYKGF